MVEPVQAEAPSGAGNSAHAAADEQAGERIRVRGLVQGVGFRPTVWRLANAAGLVGSVRNDGQGVLIRAWGNRRALDGFVAELTAHPPPLARIDRLERDPLVQPPPQGGFVIEPSAAGAVHTAVLPDAAVCGDCLAECLDPDDRRYRYPFVNCTHCGPRLSIVRAVPYDRARTSMAAFPMCAACAAEYGDPADRRFHAQPNACADCGPRLTLEPLGDAVAPPAGDDPLECVAALLRAGRVVAIKGIGGYHLACDAADDGAVRRLRTAKQRHDKPFAVMAASVAMVRRYCQVDDAEAQALESPAAPIVLLRRRSRPGGRSHEAVRTCEGRSHEAVRTCEGLSQEAVQAHPCGSGLPAAIELSEHVAPRQSTLGFMLPYTPLHALVVASLDRPMVLTSGNPSDAPQCTGDDEARRTLTGLADYLLSHDRVIVNRVDDSVVRQVAGRLRLVRRGRGYAPAAVPLPPGFETAPEVLGFGGELKNTFCLLGDGRALLSQHMGDLEHAAAFADYRRSLVLYQQLFGAAPRRLAVDAHPDYLSSQLGREQGRGRSLPVEEVQHHHAHLASCLAENAVPLDAAPVLGIALDGLGYGADGGLWGGEWLVCDYRGFRRVGALADVALPGSAAAVREPWRNLVAHLVRLPGWPAFQREFGHLPVARYLAGKPVPTLTAMIRGGVNSPPTSACGRWFDAVAALLGLSADAVSYEAQAAMELEALAGDVLPDRGYPLDLVARDGLLRLDPAPLWQAMLVDLAAGRDPASVAGRFHRGLADGVVAMTQALRRRESLGTTVALSGGVFQNALLSAAVTSGLADAGFRVLSHRDVPTNDAGLALGQAVVAAARALQEG